MSERFVIIDVRGSSSSSETTAYWYAWEQFLAGHWQRERPYQPGNYPTADREGHFNGYDRVTLCEINGELETIKSGGPGTWLGWWWSVPLPKLPKPPAWSTDE
jgi:hypothetical protein